MTPSDIASQARYITKTSSTDGVGGDADILRILNDYIQRQAKELVDLNDDKFGVKATTNLNVEANQEDYALPSDMWKLKRAEITWDGSKWYPITMVDDANFLDYALDETTINQRFTKNNPKATVYGNNLYLRPIPDTAVTAGLRIWYIRQPSDMSNLSGSIVTPSEYHGALVYGVAAEIALRQGEMDLYDRMKQSWEKELETMRRTFAPRALSEDLDFKSQNINYA